MDIDPLDDGDYEPSDDGEALVAINTNATGRVPKARARSTSRDSEDDSAGHPSKRSLKWERLKPLYKDEYLEMFQETFASSANKISNYASSQHGAVVWEASEKARLFEALPRIGRHDPPHLAERVATKSGPEIRSYLERLRSDETDRQLFERQTKNVSLAEIPAAIEIGPDCENRLEQAADALAAFQEHYDYVVGQQDYSLPFFITPDVAARLDKETDEAVRRLDEAELSEVESTSVLDHPHELFQLRMFNELSETFFMQGTSRRPHDHWRNFAEADERPAVTQDVVAELHSLVVNLTNRLVQATLFLVQSRIRASTTKHHTPRGTVKREDVQSALDVLNMRGDLWEYWVRMPRRSGFKIVLGSKRKGDSIRGILSYDEVEAALSVRHSSGRRRSLSVTSEISSNTGGGSEASNSVLGDTEDASDGSETEERFDAQSSDCSLEDHGMMEEALSDDQNHGKKPGIAGRLPPNKRKRLLEEELDQYLENMDKLARQEEEKRLASLLGFNDIRLTKPEPVELGRRPKVLRKSAEDVSIWRSAYQAAWESHPTSLPAEDLDRIVTE